MELETIQARVRLTTDKSLLASLRRRKRLTKDEKGEKLSLQFNGITFEFRPGEPIVVGERVARALVRSSMVLNGTNDLDAPYEPTLELLKSFRLDEPVDDIRSKTECPICRYEAHSVTRLAIHVATHVSKEEVEAEKADIASGFAKGVGADNEVLQTEAE